MLTLKHFRATTDKVFKAEFHPTQPWVLSCTKTDFVAVHDWSNQQVIFKAQLGQIAEDEVYADSDLARACQAKEQGVALNPSTTTAASSRSVTGKVRDIKFLDADVAAAQLAANHALAEGPSAPAPSPDPIVKSMRGQRLVVVICESKILLIDLEGRGAREIGKQALDGKTPTCCAFMFLSGQQVPPGSPVTVLTSPVLAVGFSDGQIKLFQLSTLHFIAQLTSPHKTAITCMTVGHVKASPYEVLYAGFQGGGVTSWEPFAKPLGVGRGLTIAHTGDIKVHDKEVTGLVIAMTDENPVQPVSFVFSCSLDGRVVGYSGPSLQESIRHKLCITEKEKTKIPAACMAYAPRGFVASGIHCLMVGADNGTMMSVHPVAGTVRQVFSFKDVEDEIPTGGKKHPKVYAVGIHPLQPQHAVLALNTGVAIMQVQHMWVPQAAPLPLRSPAQVLENSGDGVSYITVIGSAVYSVTASARHEGKTSPTQASAAAAAAAPPPKPPKPPKQPAEDTLLGLLDDVPTPTPAAPAPAANPLFTPTAGPAHAFHKPITVKELARLPLTTTANPTRAVISSSYDGSYVGVAWPTAKQHMIFMFNGVAWEIVQEGQGSSLAWHASENKFAVLVAPLPTGLAPAPPPPTKSGRFSKGGKEEKARQEAEARAAAAALALAASTPPTVQVWSCNGRVVSMITNSVRMNPQDVAEAVYGGPLLSVSFRRTMDNASSLYPGNEPPNAMQLYDWDGARRGSEIPEPTITSWDPTSSLVALAYKTQILVCTAQPNLHPVATLPISHATGIEWGMRQLYVCTPTHIHAAFLALPDVNAAHPAPVQVHSMVFASLTHIAGDESASTIVTNRSNTTPALPAAAANLPAAILAAVNDAVAASVTTVSSGGVPTALPRPAGPLALLGPRDGYLWVVNAHAQALALPLAKHAGIRAMCVAAAGDSMAAVEIANASLPSDQHGFIARIITDLHGNRGAQAALLLKGLQLPDEAALRIRLHQWPQAFEAVEALLAGFRQRPMPQQFSFPAATTAFNAETTASVFGRRPAGPLDLMDHYSPVLPASGRQYTDDLDWLAPLRGASSNPAAHSAMQAAGEARSCAMGTTSQQAITLALELCNKFKGMGMADAARHLLQLLLSYSPSLSTDQVSSIVIIMGELSLRQDLLPKLVNGTAMTAAGVAGESAGLAAALLSGHSSLVHDSLGTTGGAGAIALTALHSATLGKVDREAASGGLFSMAHVGGVDPNRAAWDRALAAVFASRAAAGTPVAALPHMKVDLESHA